MSFKVQKGVNERAISVLKRHRHLGGGGGGGCTGLQCDIVCVSLVARGAFLSEHMRNAGRITVRGSVGRWFDYKLVQAQCRVR